jgi:DNA-binding winged helix-turn-helix (wHTH) protein/Tfp pilus assembly protein PilF
MPESKCILFGSFEFFPERGELVQNGHRLHAQHQELLGLELLIEKRGARVSRGELTEKIWRNTSVGDNNLNVVISRLRSLLGDNSRNPHFIMTVGRDAYCFVGDVSERSFEASPRELAHELCLKARHGLEVRTPKSVKESIDLSRQAIAADSTYSLAYVGLADALIIASMHAVMAPGDAFPRARAAARRALETQPDLAEAMVSEAWVQLCFDRNFSAAAKEFERALALKPDNPFAHNGRSLLLLALNRPEEAISSMKAAWGEDALSPPLNALLSDAYYYNREFDKAIDQGNKAVEWNPVFPVAHACLGRAYLQAGRQSEAIRHLELACEHSDESPVMLGLLAYVYGKCTRHGSAQAVLQRLLDHKKTEYMPPYFIGLAYLGLGEAEKALAWIDKAVEKRSHWVLFLRTDPAFDELRSHGQFGKLVEKVCSSLLKA